MSEDGPTTMRAADWARRALTEAETPMMHPIIGAHRHLDQRRRHRQRGRGRRRLSEPGASFIENLLAALRGKNDSQALIQPSLNVSRADFETDAHENGVGSQLAGRGPYGEYAISFPAQTGSQNVGGNQTTVFDLSKVTHVLIRFDYVAAARPLTRPAARCLANFSSARMATTGSRRCC